MGWDRLTVLTVLGECGTGPSFRLLDTGRPHALSPWVRAAVGAFSRAIARFWIQQRTAGVMLLAPGVRRKEMNGTSRYIDVLEDDVGKTTAYRRHSNCGGLLGPGAQWLRSSTARGQFGADGSRIPRLERLGGLSPH